MPLLKIQLHLQQNKKEVKNSVAKIKKRCAL
jgi:hypothetical protein